jgi:aspartate 1-decarboxylase
MSEPRKGCQTPTQSVILTYADTLGNEAIDLYKRPVAKRRNGRRFLTYDIMGRTDNGTMGIYQVWLLCASSQW